MAKISVKVRSDIGDPGVHRKYGALKPGETISIDEEDFGAGLFERPAGFVSPHEQADKDRAAELKQRVGDQDPPPEEKQKKSASAPTVTEGKEG